MAFEVLNLRRRWILSDNVESRDSKATHNNTQSQPAIALKKHAQNLALIREIQVEPGQ